MEKAQRKLGVDCRAKAPIAVEVGDKVKESFGVGRALTRGHTHGLYWNTVMKIDYTVGTWLSSVFSNEWESLEICVTWDRSTCT